MSTKYTFGKVLQIMQDLQKERQEWEAEWREISEYLLPGRGLYVMNSKPRKRKLTSSKVINTIAEDALYVLTSGLHANLTSPSAPWFRLDWSVPELQAIEPLKAWLQVAEQTLYKHLHRSTFYKVLNAFFIEYCGFGNGSIYLGEDSNTSDTPLRFNLLTAGEFYFTTDTAGNLDTFIRVMRMSQKQLVDTYGKKVDEKIRNAVKNKQAGIDIVNQIVVEIVVKEKFQDKPYTQLHYTYGMANAGAGSIRSDADSNKPILHKGFYEHPYVAGRWSTIGSDTYGIGPGSRALPDIKRLQEMEKAFLMATHKSINPPLQAPGRMRGKMNTLPGGLNYYANPNEIVRDLYQMRFDYQGVSAAVERVEQRIQRNFYNDIFLTASRDPNASPLKATQVLAQKQEMTFRLGPIIERLQSEVLTPLIKRAFAILHRNGEFPELPPELESIVGDFTVTLTSPLAVAQRAARNKGVDNLLAFVGQVAQFDPSVLDNIDIDAAVRERADIEGVDIGILRPSKVLEEIRKAKAEAQQAKSQQEQQLQAQMLQLEMQKQQADIRATLAKAGADQADAQQQLQGVQ